MKLAQVLQSRKFWAAIIGLLVVFFGARANISPEQLLEAVVIVVGYILGVALDKG
jgi:hypothetical protein